MRREAAAAGRASMVGTTARAWLAAALLGAFVLQGLGFERANSQTSDEAVHLAAGYSYLATGDYRLNREHPPLLKTLAALPLWLGHRLPFAPDPGDWRNGRQWEIGRDFLYGSPLGWQRTLRTARLPNLLLGTLLVGLIGWWARRMWGGAASLLALGLAAFDPNLVAHSSLVTTDLGAALFTFVAVYLLWEYQRAPCWPLLGGIGVAVGLGLAAKFSCLLVPGILLALVGLDVARGGSFGLPGRVRPEGPRARPGQGLAAAGIGLAVALATLWLACYPGGLEPWWRGLSMVREHGSAGHAAFFLGEISSQGWWLYFPVAFLIKTPVLTLVAIALSLGPWLAGRGGSRRDALWLLLPAAVVFAVAVAGRINIGLRHILPVYPFLLVAAGRLATLGRLRPRRRALVLGLLVALHAGSTLRVAPHQLAYFNELAGGPAGGHRYLGDSNLDWGQDLVGVRELLERRQLPMIVLSYCGNAPPAALGIRCQMAPAYGHLGPDPADALPPGLAPELLAISVTSLQGTHLPNPRLYHWLAGRRPIERIGYSILVYDLTGDAEAHLELARVYLEMGPRELAVAELTRVLALRPGDGEAIRLLALALRR